MRQVATDRTFVNDVETLCKLVVDQATSSASSATLADVKAVASILTSSTFPTQPEPDESRVIESVKNRLMRDNRTRDAVALVDIWNVLQQKKNFPARSRLLSFLVHLTHYELSKTPQHHAPFPDFDLAPKLNGTAHEPPVRHDVGGHRRPQLTNGVEAHHHAPTRGNAARRLTGRNAYDTSLMRLSEQAMVRDIMYVLQGINGQYVTYSGDAKAYVIDERIDVAPVTRHILLRLAECGWLFRRIKRFTDHCMKSCSGLIRQSLAAAIEDELATYYRLLAHIQARVDASHEDDDAPAMTLRRLMLWTQQQQSGLVLLASVCDLCSDIRSGEILRTVYEQAQCGDPGARQVMLRLLRACCQPLLHSFILPWIYHGKLDDPYQEFFITCDTRTAPDDLWLYKYDVLRAMKPPFVPASLAAKILLCGKSINFLRTACGHRDAIAGFDDLSEADRTLDPSIMFSHLIEGSPSSAAHAHDTLDRIVDLAYRNVSAKLLDIFKGRLRLVDTLSTLKHYILLAKGDFALSLIQLVSSELSKQWDQVYMHNLQAAVDTALRQTSVSNSEEEQTLLDRIEPNPISGGVTNELGWDVFRLNFRVEPPLNVVLNSDIMLMYARAFGFLWRLKRLSYVLSCAWSSHLYLMRLAVKRLPGICELLHRTCLLMSEMQHFVIQLQAYVGCEVIENSWYVFQGCVNEAIDLDAIIQSHRDYIGNIVRRCFVDQHNQDIHVRLDRIFETVVDLELLISRMHGAIGEEIMSFNQDPSYVVGETERERRLHFVREMNNDFEGKLSSLRDDYKGCITQLLNDLSKHSDEHVRWLSFRLDYSQHYVVNVEERS